MTTMPIVWADSFGSQTLAAYLNTGAACTFSASAGRGGRSCLIAPGGQANLSIIGASNTAWIWSGAFFNVSGFLNFKDINNVNTRLSYRLDTGAIQTDAGGGTTIATLPPLPSAAWTFVSLRGYFAGSSTGTVDVWWNETNVLSLTGLNMPNAPSWANLVAGAGDISDVIIQAGSGGTDTPVGDRAVIWLPPNGAGTTTSWGVTGAATAWQATDESPPDGDTSYISSSTPGQITTMAMTDLPADASTVQAVVPKWYVRKTDAGSRTVAPEFRIGGANYEGTPQTMGVSYAQEFQVYSVSPATSVAWTVAEVNGAEAGVKLDA